MIKKVDRQVGEVLEALENSGQKGHTLEVFTSDHIDVIGAHRWNQNTIYFDEAVRIAFFLSLPDCNEAGTSMGLVNIGIDLFPTFCDFAGLPIPNTRPSSASIETTERVGGKTR